MPAIVSSVSKEDPDDLMSTKSIPPKHAMPKMALPRCRSSKKESSKNENSTTSTTRRKKMKKNYLRRCIMYLSRSSTVRDIQRQQDESCNTVSTTNTNTTTTINSSSTTNSTTITASARKIVKQVTWADQYGGELTATLEFILEEADPTSARIPLSLQAVFLLSNSGQDVTQVPAGNVAFRTFVRNDKSLEERSASSEPPQESPQDYLDQLLVSRGYSVETKSTLQTGYYNSEPTPLQISSYDPYLVELARPKTGNRRLFKKIMRCGISPNPCNKHGESLIHFVCRRCEPRILRILLKAGATVQVSDRYGRTPLHDACWRNNHPSFEIIEMIAKQDLRLFHLTDTRGLTPLSYVNLDDWEEWILFLESKKDVWWPAMGNTKDNTAASEVLHNTAPNTRIIEDPENALELQLASLVAAGRLTPEEAILLNDDDDENDDYSDDEDDHDDDDDDDGCDDHDDDDDNNDNVNESDDDDHDHDHDDDHDDGDGGEDDDDDGDGDDDDSRSYQENEYNSRINQYNRMHAERTQVDHSYTEFTAAENNSAEFTDHESSEYTDRSHDDFISSFDGYNLSLEDLNDLREMLERAASSSSR